MAADGGPLRTAQPAQACRVCKTRKKKCNKSLPSCGYCTRAPIEDPYAGPGWGARPPTNFILTRIGLPLDQATSEAHQGQVYLEVHGIIRATGQFVEDISARYFQGFHRHLPVISRTSFYNNLVTLGATPAADFSILLLTICLTTYTPALGYQPRHGTNPLAEQQSLYLTTRSLFAQVQVSCEPSVPLVQAGLLLAVYEYTHGQPDNAFVTIAGVARIAYAAGIHHRDAHHTQIIPTDGHNSNGDLLLQVEEAANTWWGVVISERTFFSGITVPDQPLVTVFPGGDSRLPVDIQVLDQLDILDPESIPNIPVSCLTSPKMGGFGRTAQATCLLDQVFKGFAIQDIDCRLLHLDRLDTSIQAFLALVMEECKTLMANVCTSVTIAIRSLYALHGHILGLDSHAVRATFNPLGEWHKRSIEALDTVTKIVVDTADALIARSSTEAALRTVDAMPCMYPYNARAALRHIRSSNHREDVCWVKNAEDVLRVALDKYSLRWSVSNDSTLVKVDEGKKSASSPV